jgi:hypothetical protein
LNRIRPIKTGSRPSFFEGGRRFSVWLRRGIAAALFPAVYILAGCGGTLAGGSSNGIFTLSASPGTIDTNCTGCNLTTATGTLAEQFTATLASGGAADVVWSLSGGDAKAGAGSINASGQYTPPSYLTADSVRVTVTAALRSDPGLAASTTLTVTPGFLQPLTPENAALGNNGTVTVTGYLAEAGGSASINYALSSSETGSGGGLGTLGTTYCTRSAMAFTYCTVTYTAPAAIPSTGSTYIVATVESSRAKESTRVLANTAGITSSPLAHQTQLSSPILLGSSGGNNNDYDTQGNRVADCCGGTLGSLVQSSNGTQFLLSCNHVLGRSDRAVVGEPIVQPALVDNNCMPNGEGAGTVPVGTLTALLPLNSSATNADVAIAQVNSRAVNPSGEILELGARQANGTLAAAPPGISSTGGKGEEAALNLTVAKSGRTTGLTCARVSALDLDIEVDYHKDCAETQPYLTKIFTHQIAIEGDQFSDAGDSGSLVVDAGNAEPVGLLFAGGINAAGVSEAVATPAPAVLAALSAQEGTSFTYVGTADHPVNCLSYGSSTASAAQAHVLSGAQLLRAQKALAQARLLVSPTAGILGMAVGKSSDSAGEAAVIVYVDESANPQLPQTIDGVRTEVVPATPRAVAAGTVPQTAETGSATTLPANAIGQAMAIKQLVARRLMKQNPGFFGVGVGQSLDNPKEAALMVFVDRKRIPATLPAVIDGLRVRYVFMDRLHVTRSYQSGAVRQTGHCMARDQSQPDLMRQYRSRFLDRF